jgi:hypothetical protein
MQNMEKGGDGYSECRDVSSIDVLQFSTKPHVKKKYLMQNRKRMEMTLNVEIEMYLV